MTDESKTTTPAPGQESQITETTPAPGQESQNKLLTQDDVDRIVADRLKREREKARKEFEAEKTEVERRAKLEESERLKLEKDEAEKKALIAEARVLKAERKAELTGKVTNPERVLLLMGDKAGDYFGEDGAVNAETVLKDFPEYAPAAETNKPAATPLPGVRPALGKPPSTETQMRDAAKKGNVRDYIRLSFKKE
ncbi:MAG: DUF4355 domain-containing protein [Thermaceae bacterium]|nr:DUF4355 domain-containing protein [Thermaceae bacterium]